MSTGLLTDEMLRGIAAAPPLRPAGRRLLPGDVLGDRFVIEGLAGWGGMGAVYRATDRPSGAPAAVKVLHSTRADPERFAREARTLAELEHPAIVRHLAQGLGPDGQPFLAMEWLDGLDLGRRLERGPLEIDEALALARGAAAGLAAAHARAIVHRDIKPSNLFLAGNDAARVKLVDFGIARRQANEGLVTRAGAILGTVGYMAPEQARGAADVDARADVFALGCVLYECLSGRPAFTATRAVATLAKLVCAHTPRIAALRPDVPAGLDDLVARMLEKDRDARPADGAAVLRELDRLEPAAPRAPSAGVSVILAELQPGEVERAREEVRPFGAELAELADGTVLVTLDAGGEAAACARALRDRHPGARVALAGGEGDTGGSIDRAAAQLATVKAGSGEVTLAVVERSRFRIDGEIARGGMGRILAAEDLRLRRRVALKELLLGWSPDLLRRFEREVRITARLQHPAIVGVYEAGCWPSGEPFFIMRLVTGRSLEAAIAEARTPAERLALLPHATAAVEALAYAHSLRIIHRDLKPANILVGAYGETVVIDWGLAKDLERTPGAEDSAPRFLPAPDDGALTILGTVLGTPAYMSPEQAGGGDVDERSDVYALGAILYHLLGAAPPFRGGSATAMIERVRSERPTPLEILAPDLPGDLRAIVAKAMDPDPERRYPSAIALAEDLTRFQTGRLVGAHRYTWSQLVRRFVRKNRAAVAIAATLMAVLVALSAYGVRRIVAERDLAVEHRQSAERLASFVLFDLGEKLDELGKLDLLEGVGQEIDRYYRDLAAVLPDLEPESLDRWAKALEMLGTMQHSRGDDASALESLRGRLRIRAQLLAAQPGDQDARRAVARAYNGLGIVLKRHDRAAARVELLAARAVLEPIAGERDTAWQLSSVLLELGEDAGERGDHDAALALYRRSLELRQAVARDDDDLQGVSKVQIWIADLLRDKGDLAGALDLYRRARDTRLRLVAANPTNHDQLRGLSFVHDRLAACLVVLGLLPEAEDEQARALAVTRRLVAYDAADVGYQTNLAVDEMHLGDIQRRRGDLAGAEVHLRAGLDLARRLAEGDRSDSLRQAHLAEAHQLLGHLLRDRGDARGALAAFRACVSVLEPLAAKDASDRGALAGCRGDVGDALDLAGDAAGALAAYREAVAMLEEVSRADASVVWRRELALRLGKLAARQPGEAAALRRRAVALLRALQAEGRLDAEGKEALPKLEREL